MAEPEGLADRIWLIVDGLYASEFRERAVAPAMVREAIATAR